MAKFRGITWNNTRFGPKIIVRRSIDIAEMSDLGNITDSPSDLPTSGALHRTWTDSAMSPVHGSKSGTREYTDLRYVDSNVVDTQDMGLISDAASTHRVWSSTGAITDVVTSAPTTLYNPSGSSSSSTVASTIDNLTADDGTGPEFTNSSLLGDTQYFDFNGDGTELFVHNKPYNVNAYKLTKYALSTAYDLSTATVSTNESYNIGNDYDGRFGDSGMKFYVNTGTIYQFDLQNAYEISNHISGTGSADASTAGAEAFAFKTDGTKLYTLAKSNGTNGIIQRTLSTAWDVSTASTINYASVADSERGSYANEMYGASSFDINSTGTKVYILTRYGNVINNTNSDIVIVEYDLTTAWDISTMTYNGKYFDLSGDGFISTERLTLRLVDDQYFFVRGENSNVTNNGHTIYRYDLPQTTSSSSGSSSGTTTYTGSGTFTWTVPAGVTSISAVAVGAGGGAYTQWNGDANRVRAASAGSGGSLSYANSISVTPGEVLTVYAGAVGESSTGYGGAYSSYTPSATAGESSYIARADGTVILRAKGGSGWGGSNTDSNIGDVSHTGGSGGGTPSAMNGGPGGGGAAGYAGAGGNGRVENNYGNSQNTAPTANSGGASGGYGGGGKFDKGTGGGGVGLYGLGTTASGNGQGGSGGTSGTNFNGGVYGGGAAGGSGTGNGEGGPGGVRIVWNSGASFPSTNVSESDANGSEAIFGTPEE